MKKIRPFTIKRFTDQTMTVTQENDEVVVSMYSGIMLEEQRSLSFAQARRLRDWLTKALEEKT